MLDKGVWNIRVNKGMLDIGCVEYRGKNMGVGIQENEGKQVKSG